MDTPSMLAHMHASMLAELDHECTEKVLVSMLLRDFIGCAQRKATAPISISSARSGSLGAGSHGYDHIGEPAHGRREPQRELILLCELGTLYDLHVLPKVYAQGVAVAA